MRYVAGCDVSFDHADTRFRTQNVVFLSEGSFAPSVGVEAFA